MTHKKYIITGGAGFIGSNFIRYLLDRYHDISILNIDNLTYAGNLHNLAGLEKDSRYSFIRCDICDIYHLKKIFTGFPPDYVINFAAESHVDRSIREPGIFVKSNVLGVQHVLEVSQISGIEKFVQISTDEVYGTLGKTGKFKEVTPLQPRSPYSASKAGADLLAQAYSHTYNLPINITRCSNNYGPYQHPEKLIPLTILNCLKRKPVPVYGTGLNIRDWIHVLDHCSAIDLVLHKGVPGEIFNIGANNERTNLEVVKQIIHSISEIYPERNITDNLISFVTDRKGHDYRYAIDSAKITRILKWKPKISFESGLKDTIRWYFDHINWLDSVRLPRNPDSIWNDSGNIVRM